MDSSTDGFLLFCLVLVVIDNFLNPLEIVLLDAKHASNLLDVEVMILVPFQFTCMEAVTSLVGLAEHSLAGNEAYPAYVIEEFTFEVILA